MSQIWDGWLGDGESAPAVRLVHEIRRMSFAYGTQVDAAADRFGVHPTDLRALAALLDAERDGSTEATPSWLGAQLGMNSPAVTALIDRLERRGLITRERSTADRRRVRLVVTPTATELGWSAFREFITRMLAVIEDQSQDDVDATLRVLESLRGRLT